VCKLVSALVPGLLVVPFDVDKLNATATPGVFGLVQLAIDTDGLEVGLAVPSARGRLARVLGVVEDCGRRVPTLVS
tara:strand:+ start:659 stop:886 length:228 start_codon:yes stop_codon:yes gene_type:complete